MVQFIFHYYMTLLLSWKIEHEFLQNVETPFHFKKKWQDEYGNPGSVLFSYFQSEMYNPGWGSSVRFSVCAGLYDYNHDNEIWKTRNDYMTVCESVFSFLSSSYSHRMLWNLNGLTTPLFTANTDIIWDNISSIAPYTYHGTVHVLTEMVVCWRSKLWYM